MNICLTPIICRPLRPALLLRRGATHPRMLTLYAEHAVPGVNIRFLHCAGLNTETAVGINIQKAGADPPLKPDEEYPVWVGQLTEPAITLLEINRRRDARAEGEMTFEEVTVLVRCKASSSQLHQILLSRKRSGKPRVCFVQAARWLKLTNRAKIKTQNASQGIV